MSSVQVSMNIQYVEDQNRIETIIKNYHKLDDGRIVGFPKNNNSSLLSTNNSLYIDTEILYELTKGYKKNRYITKRCDEFLHTHHGKIIDYIILDRITGYNSISRVRVGEKIEKSGKFFIELHRI